MRNKRKLTSIVLLIAMLFMAAAPAMADTATGSITISNAVDSKTYEAYRIFDLTGSGDGNGNEEGGSYTAVSYTINPAWTGFFAEGAAGAKYIVDAQLEGAVLNAITVNNNTKYINITESNVAAFAQDALAYVGSSSVKVDYTHTATADGSQTISPVTLGYYLVYPKGAAEITDGNASICSLTSTNPTATVVVKSEYPAITKTVDDSSVDVGQTVTYTITGEVPDTTGYSKYTYKVSDKMSAGLTFNTESVIVKIGSRTVTLGNETGVTVNTTATNDYDFTVTIDMTKYTTGDVVTITYTAKVNGAMITDDARVENNTAKLEYSNNPQDETSITPGNEIEVPVYSSRLVIDKYDGADNTKLSGAKFVLQNSDEKYYKQDAETKEITWVDEQGQATVVTTDSNGAADFNGISAGTYSLVEIEAPAGFNLLPEPVSVEVNATSGDDTVIIGATVTKSVANNSGTTLPSTGGIGTTIFYAAGAVLVLGAGVLLVTKRRMGEE